MSKSNTAWQNLKYVEEAHRLLAQAATEHGCDDGAELIAEAMIKISLAKPLFHRKAIDLARLAASCGEDI